jgi:hypothetical protein
MMYDCVQSQSQSYFTTGSLPPISSSWQQPLETHNQYYYFKWTLAVIILMKYLLWQEDASVIYNCCWPAPSQSFSVSSTAGLVAKFYSLRFETPPTWRARSPYLYPSGTGCPGYNPRHWVPFSSSLTTRSATVEVFDPASTRVCMVWGSHSGRYEERYLQDTTPRGPLKFNRRFRGTCRLPLLLATCFLLVSCLAYFSALNMEATCSSETSVGSQRTTCFRTELCLCRKLKQGQLNSLWHSIYVPSLHFC